jgi:hypothetical protein
MVHGRLVLAGFAIAACDRPSPPPPLAQASEELAPASAMASTVAIDPPVARGAASPNLVATSGGAMLTWLEPVDAVRSAYRLRIAKLAGGTWSPATTIAEGRAILASWADVPSVARQDNGTLVAHWAEKSAAADPHGYDVVLARSTDDGATWRRLGLAHRDGTDTEHGFVSLIPDGDAILAVWLDGRATSHGEGATALRSARIGEAIGDDRVLDDRVCDCCSTSAVATDDGPVVVYRDRTADELRDPWLLKRVAGTWSEPRPVHADGWQITGCPVNGPALVAAGRELAVAWYTAAAQKPRVQIAFSSDAGVTFERPIEVDAPRATRSPIGRVDVVLARPGEALVSWMASGRDGARLLVRRVARDGRRGPELQIAPVTAAPDAGFPRMEGVGGDVVFAWTDPRSGTVRVSRLPAVDVPAVTAGSSQAPAP